MVWKEGPAGSLLCQVVPSVARSWGGWVSGGPKQAVLGAWSNIYLLVGKKVLEYFNSGAISCEYVEC